MAPSTSPPSRMFGPILGLLLVEPGPDTATLDKIATHVARTRNLEPLYELLRYEQVVAILARARRNLATAILANAAMFDGNDMITNLASGVVNGFPTETE